MFQKNRFFSRKSVFFTPLFFSFKSCGGSKFFLVLEKVGLILVSVFSFTGFQNYLILCLTFLDLDLPTPLEEQHISGLLCYFGKNSQFATQILGTFCLSVYQWIIVLFWVNNSLILVTFSFLHQCTFQQVACFFEVFFNFLQLFSFL